MGYKASKPSLGTFFSHQNFTSYRYHNFPNQLESRCSNTWAYRRYFTSKSQHSSSAPISLYPCHATKCIHSPSQVSIILTNHNTIQKPKISSQIQGSLLIVSCNSIKSNKHVVPKYSGKIKERIKSRTSSNPTVPCSACGSCNRIIGGSKALEWLDPYILLSAPHVCSSSQLMSPYSLTSWYFHFNLASPSVLYTWSLRSCHVFSGLSDSLKHWDFMHLSLL